jgi:hypothetical protein
MKDDGIRKRWKKYFDKMFNEGSESTTIEFNDSFDNINRQFVQIIQE